MDAENTVEGEDGKPGTPEEPAASAPEGSAPGRPEEGAAEPSTERAAEPAPEATAQGAGESGPGEATPEAATPEAAPQAASDEAAPEAAPEQGEPAAAPAVEVQEPPSMGRVSLASLPLEHLEEDDTFRIRPAGEISALATDIARLGQLFPVDVRPVGPDRYQILCGFRRVAALRFLKRDTVQARVHVDLSDDDALLISLAAAIHATPVDPEELEAKREELEAAGRLSAAARDMLEKALETESGLAPESAEEEVDADELAGDVAQRLGAINQDLSLLADVFNSLDEARRAELLMQLRYSAELVAYLEGL